MIVQLKFTQWRRICTAIALLVSINAAAFECAPWVYPAKETRAETADVVPYGSGLLWNIRHPSGANSYLFGTIHLSDPRILEFSTRVEEKIAETKNFAMEVLITPDTVRFSASRMFFSEGERLSEHLPAGLFERTANLLRKHGVGREAVDRVRPWAAYMTLAVPPNDAGVPLDLHLLNLAQSHGNILYGIETIEEQLGIFEGLSLPQQVSLLSESVCNYDENQSQIGKMISVYLAQNLQGLVEIGERYQTPINADLFDKLLTDRNLTMAERIKPWLADGGFFIAVGALHLPGPAGLLTILAEAGFEINRVNLN
ncbi:MAG: TraB/GumN family protein [Gammaproteobacteria bacterium]